MNTTLSTPCQPSDQRFAARLRLIRAAVGLTPTMLAERAQLDPHHYAAYESGDRTVTAAALMQIARALQIDPALFFESD